MTEPAWLTDTVWWHVYPLGFTGAPIREPESEPRARLRLLVETLDHAAGLGFSGLALGPVLHSSTHGYDTVDYFTVDPRLGAEEDLTELVLAAHARGMRVLFDGVFNHVGQDFPAFRQALAEGPGAPAAGLFVPLTADEVAAGTPSAHGYAVFEGHESLVRLNHRSPAVVDLVVEAMTHWLDRGVDGWRLDAAYAVSTDFWAAVLPRVRERFPDTYVVGEVIHGDYAGIVAESTMDSVTEYELWKSIWSSLNDRNFFELDWTLQRHNDLLDGFVPYTFIGNHDVTRIASQLADARHLSHAIAILMTVGGTPAVYYGDEQGDLGLKEERVGGDDAIRQIFAVAEDSRAEAIRDVHRELIALRRRNPWLHRARTSVLRLENTVLAYAAETTGDAPDGGGRDDLDANGRIVVALNCGDDPVRVDGTGCGSKLAGDGELVDAGAVDLPAHGWAVLG